MRRRRWIPILAPFAVVIGFFVWARLRGERQLMESMQPYADGGDSVTFVDEYRPEDAAAPPELISIGHRGGKMSRGAIPLSPERDKRSSPSVRRGHGHRSFGGG